MCLKYCGMYGKQCRPYQMPHSVASDLGLQCLQRPIYPNTVCKDLSIPILFAKTYLSQYCLQRPIYPNTVCKDLSIPILFAKTYLSQYCLQRPIYPNTVCKDLSIPILWVKTIFIVFHNELFGSLGFNLLKPVHRLLLLQ